MLDGRSSRGSPEGSGAVPGPRAGVVHLQPYYRRTFGTAPGDCPEAERYYEGCLSLPVYPALTDEDQTRVIDALLEALG